MSYGGLAMLIILVGIGRVFFGLKGWEYYIYYWAFWAKMAAFASSACCRSGRPSASSRWRKAAAGDPAFAVPDAEIRGVRSYLHAREATVFVLIPIFAAIMARGIGY